MQARPSTAGIWAGRRAIPSCPSSPRPPRASRSTRSASLSTLSTAGTSCSCSGIAILTIPLMPRASAPSRRCATAASRRPRSCGCSRSATNPTSSCGSEADRCDRADLGGPGRSPICLRGAARQPRRGGHGVVAAADPRRILRRAAALRPTAAIALTSGEPAGIGPDLCLAAASKPRPWPLVCLGDRALLEQRARILGLKIELPDYVPGAEVEHAGGSLSLLHQPLAAPCVPGRLDRANAAAVLALIDRAVDGCLAGEFRAVVTAPVQKSLINEAGIAFTGHTEYIAERTGAALPVMMLVAANLRVALATTHLPLRAVSDALNVPGLLHVLQILSQDLQHYWGLARARIAVCGLNPHAGEGGHLGDEEQRIIGPAIAQAQLHVLLVEH